MGAITTLCCDPEHQLQLTRLRPPQSHPANPPPSSSIQPPILQAHHRTELKPIEPSNKPQPQPLPQPQPQPQSQSPQPQLSLQLQPPHQLQPPREIQPEQLQLQQPQDPPQLPLLQPEQQQFYDFDELVSQREKSKLQPQRVSLAWFQILRLVGQGSFASVFLVRCKQGCGGVEGLLAMKRMQREFTASKKVMASLLLERQILASAECEFIVQLKYAFTDRKHLYLVMEYAAGGDASRLSMGDLRQHVDKEGRIVKFVVACVVLGLQYLHSIQVIYRDLKPQNVLLFSNGYAKLTDFGLARHSPPSHHKCNTVAGTALYHAPQIVLQSGYDQSVDLWALGVLIYQLSTGQPPFKLEDVSTKLRFKRVAKEEEVHRRWRGHQLNPVLTDLLAGLLRFNPADRLGAHGFHQIKEHRYFQEVNWESLKQLQLESPLKAVLERSELEQEERMEGAERMEGVERLECRSVCVDEEWDFESRV